MEDLQEEEMLSAITAEMAVLDARRTAVLAETGEKAMPVLIGLPEFAELAAEAETIANKIADLKKQEAALLEAKTKREKEEKERLAKRTCFSCKAVNPEGSRFCEECGAKLGELPREFCKACGTMNQQGMKFCGECGAKLGV